MRALHYLNAGLWLLNAIIWTAYSGVLFMGLASLIAAVGSFYVGLRTDTWR